MKQLNRSQNNAIENNGGSGTPPQTHSFVYLICIHFVDHTKLDDGQNSPLIFAETELQNTSKQIGDQNIFNAPKNDGGK